MQYLARVILSSFLPRSIVQSRSGKIILAVTGAALVAVPALILVRRLDFAGPSVAEELGIKPLRATDERGDKWVIEPAVAQPFARLRAGRAKPGPPLTVRPDVQHRGAGEVSIGLTIVGRAGEKYRPDLSRNGSPLPAPELTIINGMGKVIHKDQFKFG
jgi:hypothetical protein